MDADTPVAHERLMDEVIILGDRGPPPSRIRSLYPLYGLLGIAYIFIFVLCLVSFSRVSRAPNPASRNETIPELADMKNSVYAVSEKAEALKSEFGTDFDELHLKVQNISSRADTSESDLSSLTSEVQKTSSRVEAMGSDLSSLKLQVSVLSSQFLKMKKLLEVENPCDFLWKSFEGYCYFFYKEELNWMDAKEMCELKNATLAVITSAREQNFLSSRIENEQYWIGLSDANKEGEWEWIDGTDYKSSFKFWKKGEPNDSERNEDCAHLLRKGEWNDLLCTSLSYAICKKAALTP